MALTLAVFAFVQIAAPLWVRPHLVAPEEKTIAFSEAKLDGIQKDGAGTFQISLSTGDPGDWVLSNQSVDAAGQVATLPGGLTDCLPHPLVDVDTCFSRLNDEGYRQRLVYQPADRFWALQWTETVLYLALSGLLAWFCFWWTRRRLA